MTSKCTVCQTGIDIGDLWRCDEHRRCDDCGTRENLLISMRRYECHTCEQARILREIEQFDGDTDCTDQPVCPHCGHEQSAACEMSDGVNHCDNCERPFELHREYSVTYSTTKLRQQDEP